AKHAAPNNSSWGVDGTTGKVVDMHEYGIWEPYAVKSQTLKTAIESACLLLRVDDIVSGLSKGRGPSAQQAIEQNEMMEQ
ncbi:T-complex protein 1 subunit gamma, partial [Globomyces sp. JEL0801]